MSLASDQAKRHRDEARSMVTQAERILNADHYDSELRHPAASAVALIGIGEALLAIAESLAGVVFVQDAGRE